MDYHDYIDHYDRDSFDHVLHSDMPWFRRQSEQRRYDTVARAVIRSGGGRILDAGCGIGGLARMLAAPGRTVVGADLGLDALRRAISMSAPDSPPVRYVQADSYRLPFGDGAFDAVVSSEVIEHMEEPARALAEYRRVLRPGGVCVVSTPYRERLRYTRCIHCNELTPVNAHLHTFDEHSLGGLMEGAGMRVESFERFSNRYAEVLGLSACVWFLPYTVWRTLDRITCAVTGRPSFVLMKAVRRD